jgi:Alpha/beta hydrolase domain
MATRWRGARGALTVLAAVTLATTMATAAPSGATPAGPTQQEGDRRPVPSPEVDGPLPGTAPGDPASPNLEETYPFFSTWVDLARAGYVEQEFTISGAADAYAIGGELLAEDVPYETRIVVRRPTSEHRSNGTVLMEWQNVSAGYDLDALWNYPHIIREGYTWVGVSAQRVGVDHLRGWSPTRYGDLDVTGGGRFVADELSYDIFAQAAQAIRGPERATTMGGLDVDNVLAIGASQSAGRMTVYYDNVLPQTEAVFDGYGFIVGSAPSREGDEPVFHVLSETDVRSTNRRPDSDLYRRWEVAGGAHSGWNGQEYRQSISERDLGAAPTYDCDRPPFSRVPVHHVTGAAYDHLVRWVEDGTPPPTAEPIQLNADGTKVRDELGLAQGGIRLSQVEVPTALNTGENSGPTFCRLFGSYEPFDEAQLAELYHSRGDYIRQVAAVDRRNVRAGYIPRADAWRNLVDAVRSGVGG